MAWHLRSPVKPVNREPVCKVTSISHSGLIASRKKSKTENILARFHSVGGHSTLVIGHGLIICTTNLKCTYVGYCILKSIGISVHKA